MPHVQTKQTLRQDSRRHVITIKSNPLPLVSDPQTGGQQTIPKPSYCCEGSELHQAPQPGNLIKALRIPVNLTLKSKGILLQDFHRTWSRDSILGGHKQDLAHTKTQRKGEERKNLRKCLKKIIAKNFPNMGKEALNQVQEVQGVPGRTNPRKNTP